MQGLSKFMTYDWGLMQNADHVHRTVPVFVSLNPQNYEAGAVPSHR